MEACKVLGESLSALSSSARFLHTRLLSGELSALRSRRQPSQQLIMDLQPDVERCCHQGSPDPLLPQKAPSDACLCVQAPSKGELVVDLDCWQLMHFPTAVMCAVCACHNGVKRAHLVRSNSSPLSRPAVHCKLAAWQPGSLSWVVQGSPRSALSLMECIMPWWQSLCPGRLATISDLKSNDQQQATNIPGRVPTSLWPARWTLGWMGGCFWSSTQGTESGTPP